MFGVIWFHTVKSQTENDFSCICYKLFFIVFLYHFYLFCTRSWIIQILGSQDHFKLEVLKKVIKFTITFKIFDFHYPHILFCNFQNSGSEKMWCCLTFVCMYILWNTLYEKITNIPIFIAGTLFGITNIFGTAAGMLGPLVVGLLTNNKVCTVTCRGPWMSTIVLYCWCHSDSASVLLYFTFLSHLFPLPCGAGSTVPSEGFDSSVIMPFSWCVVAVTLLI